MLKRAFFISILLFAEAAFGQTIFNRVTGWEAGIPALTPGQCAMATTSEELGMVACPGAAALQNLFETMNAPLGSDPVADSPTDTLNLAQSTCLTITGDSGTDTLTWAVDFTCTPTWSGLHTWSAGGILLNDNVKLLLGTGSDAEIYYSGSDLVQKVPVGDRIIQQTDKLKWLTSAAGMTITDVLDREIIKADALNLTIKNLDLVIEKDIDLWGTINIRPNNETISGTSSFIQHTSTITLDNALSDLTFLATTGQFDLTTIINNPPKLFSFGATLRAVTNPVVMYQPYLFNASPYFLADGVSYYTAHAGFFQTAAFLSSPVFGIAGGGSFNAASNYAGFKSRAEVLAGTTFPEVTHYGIVVKAGAGTLGKQIGFKLPLMTGAGINIGIENASTLVQKPRTPPQITADQNDYASCNVASMCFIDSDASRNITGMLAAEGGDGEFKFLLNDGSNDIVLVDESASSAAANRFNNTVAGTNITLSAGEMAICAYANSRWVCSLLKLAT